MLKLNEKQTKLVEDNHKLVYWFLNKYNLDIDEHYGYIAHALCKAALYYDENRNTKFTTYAVFCMENERKLLYRKKHVETISYNILIKSESNVNNKEIEYVDSLYDDRYDIEQESYVSIAIKNILEELTDKEILILKLIYSGYNQTEVGEIVNYTQSYVCKILQKVKEKIIKEIG